MEQAVKANQIQEKSFKIGASTYLDLRDSEDAVMSSKLAYYQAIYNYLVASSNLELLLGNAEAQYPTNAKEAKERTLNILSEAILTSSTSFTYEINNKKNTNINYELNQANS